MQRTRRVSGSCLGLLVALACHPSSRDEVFDANIPLHPHSGKPALASLHVERASPLPGLAEPSEALPIRIALWADGTLCWSGDLQHGGAPYSVTHVEASQVTEVLERLRSILDDRVGSAPSYVVPVESTPSFVVPTARVRSSHSSTDSSSSA